jgi:CheY-like chemotaxis protein
VLKSVREAERTANVPVLVLTAKHITKEDLRFLTRNNISQLIQKGDVNREDLLNAISSVLPHGPAAARAKRNPPAIEGKPVVLVVEDNPDNMLTMKALLAREYIVIEAADGPTGVELARSRKPHLILMDVGLPEKDGVAVFKEIRNNLATAHIPVIAVTASALVSDRETILAHGFDAYVAKPIDAAELFSCIREVLYGI